MSHDQRLVYERLPQTPGSIRLLSVLKHTKDDMICCELSQGSTDQKYHTLSYTWGSTLHSKHVLVNDQKVSVRRNLWEFLKVARQHYPEKPIWIDAISINQGDDAERNQQVRMMGQIYKCSRSTLIWLGPPDILEGSDDFATSDISLEINLQNIDRQLIHFEEKIADISDMSEKKICERLPEIKDLDIVCQALEALLRHPYWSRMWIIQELNLSKKKTLLFDGKKMTWSSLKAFVDEIDSFHTEIVEEFGRVYRKHQPGKGKPQWQLRETIMRFYIAQSESLGYSMMTQNAPDSKSLDLESNVVEFLRLYEDARCFDRRDKLYGLHSMVRHIVDFPIDYAADVYELFYGACQYLDDFEAWPARFSGSDDDASESDESTDIDGESDGMRITARNHFRELGMQLIRTFDLGPLDLLFGDQNHRSFAVLLAEQEQTEEISKVVMAYTIPNHGLFEQHKHEICRLAMTDNENEERIPLIALCPRCKRVLVFEFNDGHPYSTLIGLLQCHVGDALEPTDVKPRDNHLILYGSDWISGSSIPDHTHHENASCGADDEFDASDTHEESAPSEDADDSTSSSIDSSGSYYSTSFEASACHAGPDMIFTLSLSVPDRNVSYSRKDLFHLLELHKIFWTSDFHYHGGGTRHEFVKHRESQLHDQLEKFIKLLEKSCESSMNEAATYGYTTSMLDALHLEEKARDRMVQILEQVGIRIQR